MRLRCQELLRVLAVVSWATVAAAQAPLTDTPHVIYAARMLDVRQGRILPDVVVVIRGETIESVRSGEASFAPPPADAKVTRLPARLTLLPGLIDAHTHITWDPQAQRSDPQGVTIPREPLIGAGVARRTLDAGFTTVRSLGSTGYSDLALRDAIADGYVPGPRIQAAVTGLGPPGGVCDAVFQHEGTVQGSEAAVAKVKQLIAAGAGVIKLCAGGGVLPQESAAQATEFSEAELRAMVEEAHRQGRKAAAHAQGPEAIRRAVEAGVDSIEHGGLIDETSVRRMKERNVFLVPTLYRLDWTLENAEKNAAPAAALERLRRSRQLARDHVASAIRSGVLVAFGTDATVFPHGLNAREFAVLVALGMSPIEAIRSATLNAAQLLGWEGKVGVIEPGAFADLIAVEGNPLEDVTRLERTRLVMMGGTIVKDERAIGPQCH
ncbi:MAG: amidohydrolase family protein [Acidobacteria bacterium]|nr:amidohydrolase family protein [Acidobacteriota bacterium]